MTQERYFQQHFSLYKKSKKESAFLNFMDSISWSLYQAKKEYNVCRYDTSLTNVYYTEILK
jgi:hypothetical protein